MVSTTTREDMTWYECDECGLLFDSEDDARQHHAIPVGHTAAIRSGPKSEYRSRQSTVLPTEGSTGRIIPFVRII